ncbi:MAG: DUF2939 domain-containing protein [Sphingomonadaceae bacterium]|nr:DUF2939 domain-containing protein [Sphingomonadaceae bacterium]
MAKLFVWLLVAAAICAGLFAASPYYTLAQMSAAAAERDDVKFASYVDFEAIRDDMKSSVQGTMIGEIEERGNAGDTAGAAGMALGMLLADRMIDGAVSPEALRAIFDRMRHSAMGDFDPSNPSSIRKLFDNTSVDWHGLSEFRLVNENDARAPELIFSRSGLLSWKLSGVDLNDEAVADI